MSKNHTEQRPKQKPDLHVLNIMLIIEMSKHQIIEERPKQKADLHLRTTYHQYHHFPLETKHLEVKRNQNIIILNRNMNLKARLVGHKIFNQNRILKDHLLLKKTKTKKNPTPTPIPRHDTDIVNGTDYKFLETQNLATIKDQSNKRGFRNHKTPNGSKMNKPHYLAEIRKMLNGNTWLMMD